jgi:hypothetical protein
VPERAGKATCRGRMRPRGYPETLGTSRVTCSRLVPSLTAPVTDIILVHDTPLSAPLDVPNALGLL